MLCYVQAMDILISGDFQTVSSNLEPLDIPVSDGDLWGFYWMDYGITSFRWLARSTTSPAINRLYRGKNGKAVPGITYPMEWSSVDNKDGHSYRDYAIWVYYC